MRIIQFIIIFSIGLLLTSCMEGVKTWEVTSPGEINKVSFMLSPSGQPCYIVFHRDTVVLDTSYMSFDLKDQEPISSGFKFFIGTPYC